MLVFGVVLGLPGTVLGLPETVAELGLTLTSRGTLISALFVGLLVGCLLSGAVVDALGYRASLAVSLGLVAIAMPLLAMARTAVLAGTAIVALGVAAAGVNTASNALSSDFFPGERARRMNRLAILAGIGGLTMPVAISLSSAGVSWRTIVVAGGALSALLALACAWVPPMDTGRLKAAPTSLKAAPTSLNAAPTSLGQRHSPLWAIRRFAGQPGFAWLGLALLLGGGNEAALAGWISTYVQAAGFSASAATWVLASHWLGLIVARTLLSPRVERVKTAAIVRSAIAGAVCVALFVVVRAQGWLAISPFVIGFSIALIVPTTLALAGDRYPGNTGALFGLLLTLLQVGGIALPATIGLVSDRAGLRPGVSVIALSCLCIAGVVRLALHRDQVESGSTS